MTIRVFFQESKSPRFVYLAPGNTVQVMLPLTECGEEGISTDNTCQAVKAAKSFFYATAEGAPTAIECLERYKSQMEVDLLLLANASAAQEVDEKRDRIQQVSMLIEQIRALRVHDEFTPLQRGYPTMPRPVADLFSRTQSNVLAAQLSPPASEQDGLTRFEPPHCSFNRNDTPETFAYQLRSQVLRTGLPNKGRAGYFLEKLRDGGYHQVTINSQADLVLLKERLRALFLGEYRLPESEFSLDSILFGSESFQLDYETLTITLGLHDEGDTVKSFINTILKSVELQTYCRGGPRVVSPLNDLNPENEDDKSTFSIICQFFIAEINNYCVENGRIAHGGKPNFGQIIEASPPLKEGLIQAIRQAVHRPEGVIEDALLQFITDASREHFGIESALIPVERNEIKRRFYNNWRTISNSAHYDEFLFFQKNPRPALGQNFYMHQGSICVPLSLVLNEVGVSNPLLDMQKRVALRLSETKELSESGYQTTPTVQLEQHSIDELAARLLENPDASDFSLLCKALAAKAEGEDRTKKQLFECISSDVRNQMTRNPNWETVRAQILQQLPENDENTLRKFNDCFAKPQSDRALFLALEDTKALHTWASLEREASELPNNHHTLTAVRRMLHSLDPSIEGTAVAQGANGRYIVSLTNQQAQMVESVINGSCKDLRYITPEMTRLIYRQVQERFGEASAQYQQMQRLNNAGQIPHKFTYALEALDLETLSISFPRDAMRGYIVGVLPEEFATDLEGRRRRALGAPQLEALDNVLFTQSWFRVTPEMARAVYMRVTELGLAAELEGLSNENSPDKFSKALELLGLPAQEIYFNDRNGYYVCMHPGVTLGFDRVMREKDKPTSTDMQARPVTASPSPRQRQLVLSEQSPEQPHPIVTAPSTGQALAAVFGTNLNQFIMQPVIAFNQRPLDDHLAAHVLLHCPQGVLLSFKELIRQSGLAGQVFFNPYTNEEEVFPEQAENFTAKHLLILARNERVNTTGTMNVALYNGHLTDNQIASIRCLAKFCTVVGACEVNAYGGFMSQNIPLNPAHTSIIVDQAGPQWQADLRNSGGLYFYPDELGFPQLPEAYHTWQNDMFRAVFGRDRPEVSGDNSIPVRWNGVTGRLDLDLVAQSIASDFWMSLEAVRDYISQNAELSAQFPNVLHKFLKAGMGFFASGLQASGEVTLPDIRVRLEASRLAGINLILEQLLRLPVEQRQGLLGNIRAVELPFSNIAVPYDAIFQQIGANLQSLGLQWCGVPNQDALMPREGFTVATTNCADPHAMPGNEGGHQSVDASIATNANTDCLIPAYNRGMQERESSMLRRQFIGGEQQALTVTPVAFTPSYTTAHHSAVSAPAAPMVPLTKKTLFQYICRRLEVSRQLPDSFTFRAQAGDESLQYKVEVGLFKLRYTSLPQERLQFYMRQNNQDPFRRVTTQEGQERLFERLTRDIPEVILLEAQILRLVCASARQGLPAGWRLGQERDGQLAINHANYRVKLNRQTSQLSIRALNSQGQWGARITQDSPLWIDQLRQAVSVLPAEHRMSTPAPQMTRLERNKIAIRAEFQALEDSIRPERGAWIQHNEVLEFGRSAYTGYCGFATPDWVVEFTPDLNTPLRVLDKANGYRPFSPENEPAVLERLVQIAAISVDSAAEDLRSRSTLHM